MKKLTAFMLAMIMSFTYFAVGNAKDNSAKAAQSGSNILVAYFSCTEHTKGIAEHIENILDADIYQIEPAVPYTAEDLDYYSGGRADQEQADPNARPEISGSIDNIEDYDVIFLGYPIWHGQAPKIIYTFLESYDFSGKLIVPFCTSMSSPLGTSAENLHSLASGADWNSGRRFDIGSSEATVKAWTDTIELPEPEPTPDTPTATPVINIDDKITVENVPENATLIMAFYKNSVLCDVKLTKGSGTITEDIPNRNADKMKAFLWDMQSIKPLCDAREIPMENSIDDDLILINGGTFQMGSPAGEPEREADEVQHSVTVDSFYMSGTELTQKEYQSLIGSNPSENKGDNLPVENITWYDAINYCNELSKSKGLTPCYTVSGNTVTWDKSANGYRLPTEAEWEYAARTNTTTPFNFGDYVNDTDANCYNAYGYNNDASGSWVNGYLSHTVSVDSYNANGYGLYNMHGNVGEWVWDWYSEYGSGSDEGNYKVVRGGGWNDFPKHIRSAYRSAYPANVPLYSIGMRLVRSADTSSGTVTSINNADPDSKANKTLIVYFSQTGNTVGLANIIQEMSGADIFRIERKEPYSSNHNGTALYGEALNEQRTNAIPELRTYLEDSGIDINQYDTILLGYCNWWASIPAPVRTFLTHYDLSGKTIIPFCSMGGGRFGQTISAVAKLAPDSTIKEGLDVTYSSYNRNEISAWLTKHGIIE